MKAVTSFSQKGFFKYGKKFLESYLEHWKIPLVVYTETDEPPCALPVTWRPLHADPDRAQYLKAFGDLGRKDDYRFNSTKFCHKVFAMTDPWLRKSGETILWLDADIVTHAPVDEEFLKKVIPEGFAGAFLGRKDWPHSECGFTAFNPGKGYEVLEGLRKVYISGELFQYAEWHDSFIFDALRRRVGGWWYNISSGIPGNHVFDDSILGSRMKHLKGAERKAGQIPQNPNMRSGNEILATQETQAGKVNLLVKTKNCVRDEQIQANIHYSSTVNKEWMKQCDGHEKLAVFCSGGPSLESYLEEIRQLQSEGGLVICVKHAHDRLIEAGIVPWACVLLDPRAHVQDFIENPHPDVIYFTASMCHPSTWDRLIEKKARVIGYHAHVGAGEQDVLLKRLGDHMLLSGGCSAALRGMAVLKALGFRNTKLYGYDLCYPDPAKLDMNEKGSDGQPKFFEAEVLGRKFWTDAEKIAQCQNFEFAMKQLRDEMTIEAYGPGIVPHMWAHLKTNRPRMEDLYGKARLSAS